MDVIVDFIDMYRNNSWSTFLTTSDEILLNDVWYRNDPLLVSMSQKEPFIGKTALSDLDIQDYQILLMSVFELLSENQHLTSEIIDHQEPFATFRFLATALAKAAIISGIVGFDTIGITRINDDRIVVEFRKALVFDFQNTVAAYRPINVPSLRLVVDNS